MMNRMLIALTLVCHTAIALSSDSNVVDDIHAKREILTNRPMAMTYTETETRYYPDPDLVRVTSDSRAIICFGSLIPDRGKNILKVVEYDPVKKQAFSIEQTTVTVSQSGNKYKVFREWITAVESVEGSKSKTKRHDTVVFDGKKCKALAVRENLITGKVSKQAVEVEDRKAPAMALFNPVDCYRINVETINAKFTKNADKVKTVELGPYKMEIESDRGNFVTQIEYNGPTARNVDKFSHPIEIDGVYLPETAVHEEYENGRLMHKRERSIKYTGIPQDEEFQFSLPADISKKSKSEAEMLFI